MPTFGAPDSNAWVLQQEPNLPSSNLLLATAALKPRTGLNMLKEHTILLIEVPEHAAQAVHTWIGNASIIRVNAWLRTRAFA